MLTAIAVGLDGTETDDVVVARAAAIAYARGAALHLVLAVEPSLGARWAWSLHRPTPTLDDPVAPIEDGRRAALERWCERLRVRGVDAHAVVRRGDRHRVLADVARATGAELVVSHRRRPPTHPTASTHASPVVTVVVAERVA